MGGITYIKKTKNLKKDQLPKLIDKYNLITVPFGRIGEQYIGNGISIIVDKRDVRINVYQKESDFSMSEFE